MTPSMASNLPTRAQHWCQIPRASMSKERGTTIAGDVELVEYFYTAEKSSSITKSNVMIPCLSG